MSSRIYFMITISTKELLKTYIQSIIIELRMYGLAKKSVTIETK